MKGYARRVRRVLAVVLGLNALVAAAKLLVGWRAGSLAVFGDGLHSAVDALANVVGLIVLYLATRPADEDHPYGHAKFETLAAFVVSALMVLTAFELARAAAGRLADPTETTFSTATLAVMAATLVVNVGVSRVEGRIGREAGSDLLVADAAQTRVDVFVTLAILASVPLQRAGLGVLDPLLAFAVAILIAYAAWGVFRQALPVLTDRVVYDPAEVARIVHAVPGVVSVHDIRSRGSARESFVQMHLVVGPDDVAGAHAVADAVEAALARELGVKEVFVHVEPEDDRSGPPGTAGDPPGASRAGAG